MAFQQAIVLLLGALISTTRGESSSGQFLGHKRKVSSSSVQAELTGVLGEVLGHGHGLTVDKISKIHRTLDPLFPSLPKNTQGRISSDVMRYAVRRYFSQSHGWIVKGFNAHEEVTNISSATDTLILQEKLPGYIRSTLEDRFAHDGFSLDGVVAMVASLERLVFDEVVRGVELAFYLNSMDLRKAMNAEDLFQILGSFLITEMLDGSGNIEAHQQLRETITQVYPFWDTTLLFLKDSVNNDIWLRQKTSKNPFAEQAHSFEDAVRMAQQVSDDFGTWSNHECHEMKDMLASMDVHGTGRVKVSDFYGYSKDGAWQFLEPSEQLRRAGSLDVSSTWLGPQVMIANYINQMSNCITTATYYSICCLNECDQVYRQLEAQITSPVATPSEIIRALQSGAYAAPNISKLHRDRLDEIAQVSDGTVPMHGRLFARWLHFLYPLECPYPHAAGVVSPMSQKQWRELVGEENESATDDEIAQHLESEFANREPSPEAGVLLWTLEEALLESSTPSDSKTSSISSFIRMATQVGMLLGFISVLRPLLKILKLDGDQKVVNYEV